MSIVWAGVIVVVAVGAAVTAMLVVRRRAPDGGFVADGDRAAGVFGVIATGFSVLLGFLIFLAFESYDASRTGAETEALIVAQQVQTAQLLPAGVREDLTGELVCYARFVINDEWDEMEAGTLDAQINPWGAALFTTLRDVDLTTPVEETAYGKWLDQTSDRELGRQDRIHGASGVMPTYLWIGLFILSAIVLAFVFAFADSGERAVLQGLYMGSIVGAIAVMLLLLSFLNDAFRPGIGGLQPSAMERTLVLIDGALDAVDAEVTIPCDAEGRP